MIEENMLFLLAMLKVMNKKKLHAAKNFSIARDKLEAKVI